MHATFGRPRLDLGLSRAYRRGLGASDTSLASSPKTNDRRRGVRCGHAPDVPRQDRAWTGQSDMGPDHEPCTRSWRTCRSHSAGRGTRGSDCAGGTRRAGAHRLLNLAHKQTPESPQIAAQNQFIGKVPTDQWSKPLYPPRVRHKTKEIDWQTRPRPRHLERNQGPRAHNPLAW